MGQHGHRKQSRIGRTRSTNRKGGHWHAFGHLDDAVQGVHPLQMLTWYRHAQHRHHGFSGQHARQVGGTTRSGNDDAQSSRLCALGVGKHIVGHAVGRHHFGFKRNAKVVQDLRGVLHGVPV